MTLWSWSQHYKYRPGIIIIIINDCVGCPDTVDTVSARWQADVPSVSRMFLYKLMESVSFMNSLTTSPWSFSTTSTSSGLAMRDIITCRTWNHHEIIVTKSSSRNHRHEIIVRNHHHEIIVMKSSSWNHCHRHCDVVVVISSSRHHHLSHTAAVIFRRKNH